MEQPKEILILAGQIKVSDPNLADATVDGRAKRQRKAVRAYAI